MDVSGVWKECLGTQVAVVVANIYTNGKRETQWKNDGNEEKGE